VRFAAVGIAPEGPGLPAALPSTLESEAKHRALLIERIGTNLHAHLALKEAALAKLKPYKRSKRTRFQPNDRLLAFLEALQRSQTAEWNGGTLRLTGRKVRANRALLTVP
jgi:hypothetical protein